MIVESIKHAQKVFERLHKNDYIVLDTETVGLVEREDALRWHRMRINMFSVCFRGESYSFPVDKFDPKYPSMMDYAKLLDPIFRDRKIVKVCHNINYDYGVFTIYDLKMFNWWDTMIGGWLADANVEKSLKVRAPLFGHHLDETKTIDFTNLKELAYYAEQDVVVTDELYQMQSFGKVIRQKKIPFLTSSNKLVRLENPLPVLKVSPDGQGLTDFEKIFLRLLEFPVLSCVLRAEAKGIRFNSKRCLNIRHKVIRDIELEEKKIFRFAKRKFNVNSTKQVTEVFDDLGIEIHAKTKKGAPSVNYESLFNMRGVHPIIEQMINYRQLKKLEGYVSEKGLLKEVFSDKRIHCSLNTVGAVTGRFSSSKPNLQQIPSAKDRYGIKSCFTAPKRRSIVCLDLSQVEIRVMCLFCKDPAMERVLRDPKGDIHMNTAKEFDVDRSPTAKQLNFLLLYGGGAYMLANKLSLEGIPTDTTTASSYIDQYNSTYSGVREWREQAYEWHRKNGFYPYLLGRTRKVENLSSSNKRLRHKAETQLANNIIQGSAQDWLKCTIVRCDPRCVNPDKAVLRYMDFSASYAKRLKDYSRKLVKYRELLKKTKTQLLVQVHDELVFETEESAQHEVADLIGDIMTWHPYFEPLTNISVPIGVEGGYGKSWADAKKNEVIVRRGDYDA